MTSPSNPMSPASQQPQLRLPGWSPRAIAVLNRELELGNFAGRAVTADHDGTLVYADIGEATFEVLVRDGSICFDMLSPPLRSLCGVDVPQSGDLIHFYQSFVDRAGPNIGAEAATKAIFRWLVQAMNVLTVKQVVEAAEKALNGAELSVFPRPRLYPEMGELLAAITKGGGDIWIVSASNPWSVRVSVNKLINPALMAAGGRPIAPNRVIGLAVNLQDADGSIKSDFELVTRDEGYARGDPIRLEQLMLTSVVTEPASAYGGKVECRERYVGSRPLLSMGDSSSDLPMLKDAELQLVVGRKPEVARLAQQECGSTCLVQNVEEMPNGGGLRFCP